eukprot:CAMPEP_0119327738 /NCGR_PEP_ID=MMETSP1333-20130426/71572_1 /TAXON_ID=418940 /ORGANISM="Scyphosphaera apsteinii, Strain RCC1455" /LENGTH=248 /DNA_ID=CAMNT_0007336421 /DNA_START=54 /DNA_END=799 /DNA_ORIENTATION=-
MGTTYSAPDSVPQIHALEDTGFQRDSRIGRLRLLCLHGSGSNNAVTELQVANLGLWSRHRVACDFLQATQETDAQNQILAQLFEAPFYQWFRFHHAILSCCSSVPALSSAIARIMQVIKRCGPYDGLFGFSQGALMVTCLSSPLVWKRMYGLSTCPWRFVICANAGGTSVLQRLRFQGHRLKEHLPICSIFSLHLVGRQDGHRSASEALIEYFQDVTKHIHPYGHELPMPLKDDAELAAVSLGVLRPV